MVADEATGGRGAHGDEDDGGRQLVWSSVLLLWQPSPQVFIIDSIDVAGTECSGL
jgi:hypothetical protein